MQNLKIYTDFFNNPRGSGDMVFREFLEDFSRFDRYYKDHTPTNAYGEFLWVYPKKGKFENLYNIILKKLSEYMGVKAMYKDSLDSYDDVVKGFLLIGDYQRVEIVGHIFNHILDKVLVTYYNSLTEKGFKKLDASNLINSKLQNIINTIDKLLVTDLRYISRLELYILNSYKLDFKSYNCTDEYLYYHAVSNKYKSRRLLV